MSAAIDHPDQPQVRALVATLTQTQRKFVGAGCIHGDFTMATVRALIRKGAFAIVPDSPNGRWGFARLTVIGEHAQRLIKSRRQVGG